MDADELWRFLPVGFLLTVAIETPVLMALLSKPHPMSRRVFAGVWLTACSYPIVILVMPLMFESRFIYLIIAETFAPAAECVLFFAAFAQPGDAWRDRLRDAVAITLANLASFGIGVLVFK